MMRRRDVLVGGLALGCSSGNKSAVPDTGVVTPTVIDTHTHFYDPGRPGGIPWPPPTDPFLYRKFMPDDYEAVARPLGITGTVLVEAVWKFEDNLWALELAEATPMIVAVIGNLTLGSAMFASQLETLTQSRFFRGTRAGLANAVANRDDLVAMGEKGLTVDLNPSASIADLTSVARVAQSAPRLNVVIDHCANVISNGGAPPVPWMDGMSLCAAQPNITCKVSGLVDANRRTDAPSDLALYRPVLDHLWNVFGEDRLFYGSNWPVSFRYAPLSTVHAIVTEYLADKGARASDKFFAANSKAAYGWIQR